MHSLSTQSGQGCRSGHTRWPERPSGCGRNGPAGERRQFFFRHAPGARRLSLDVLASAEAIDLLTSMLGDDRVSADLEAVSELADACGRLPLALRVAVANLAGSRQSLRSYLTDLASGERLIALAVEDDPHSNVLIVFEQSYRTLTPAQQRFFRLLGAAPALDSTAEAAAALTGLSLEETNAILRALVEAHLVHEHLPGRFTMHDLIREYAAHLAALPEHVSERDAAVSRLVNWTLARVDAAVAHLYPNSLRLGAPGQLAIFDGSADSVAWLDAEVSNLSALVESATAIGHADAAWRIPFACRSYFFLKAGRANMIALGSMGLSAARAVGDALGEAASELVTAQAYNLAGHDHRASFHAERCRAIAGSAGWREMEVDALNAMSVDYMHTGDLRRSAECAREAFDICVALGKTPTQHLGKLGLVSLLMGALPEAVDCLEQTLAQQREQANHSRAITLLNLGDAYRYLGRMQEAERSLHESIRQSEAVGSHYIAAVARSTLVQVYCDTGRFVEAWEQARISRSVLEDVPDELARVQMWHAWGGLLMQTRDVGEAVKVLEAALNPARNLAFSILPGS